MTDYVTRAEFDALQRRVDLMEGDMKTQIAAVERKHDNEIADMRKDIGTLIRTVADNTRSVANLSSQVLASHHSLVHLLAVTARQVRVPDKDLEEAMRMARETIK